MNGKASPSFSRLLRPRAVLAAALTVGLAACKALAQATPAPPALIESAPASMPDLGRPELEHMVAQLIHRAIPLEYEKKKDWGATKEVPVGVRVEGKPFHYHVN